MVTVNSVKSGSLQGRADIPGDKSVSQRAAIMAGLAVGETSISGLLDADDMTSTLEAVEAFGARISRRDDHLAIEGVGLDGPVEPMFPVNLGNSGTGLRLMLGAIAGRETYAVFTGDASLSSRPMARVSQPLREMGARIDGRSDGNLLPITIRGTQLSGRTFSLPVASAQVKSALLLAGLSAKGVTQVTEPGPSRDHTERMLPLFGVEVHKDEVGRTISIEGPVTLKAPGHLVIPRDPSSAAFIAVAAAMVAGSDVEMDGVSLNPTRTGWIDVMKAMGADISIFQTGTAGGDPIGMIRVHYAPVAHMKGVTISGELIPRTLDEIPVLAVIASQVHGQTVISDAEELRVKETDRLEAIAEEWANIGLEVELTRSGLQIEGPQKITGGLCDARGDHRMAMSLAIAGLVSEKPVRIRGFECVSVSFPGFIQTMQSLGADLQ